MRKDALAATIAATFTGMTLLFASTGPAGAQPGALPPEKTNVHPKIESVLTELGDRYDAGPLHAQAFARDRRIEGVDGNKVTVFVVMNDEAGLAGDGAETLRRFGADIVKSAGRIIKARIPLDRIRRIADAVPGVLFIQLPDRPHPLAVTSEGVNLTQASRYHAAGVTGAGVKVAVIDVGFADLSAAIASGDLPSGAVRVDCTGATCESTPTTFDTGETENHGTAVAEIVRDMAPGAQLYLIKMSDRIDLLNAKDYCIANGIRVINHSVAWFNTNFYDGVCHPLFLNPVCTADSAAAAGIVWVNAAGNHARGHYEATFTDADADGYHDQEISVTAASGETVDASLTWNAWPMTDQDYDIFLVDSNDNVVESSQNPQFGYQPPVETVYVAAPADGTYRLRILKSSAASDHRFELFSYHNILTPSVPTTSIIGPADAASVIAVAAIDQADWTTGPQEYFSSQGPTTDGRVKPDISGPDGVSTSFGVAGFYGTSAASPHVAGAAALILSRDPTYSVPDVRSQLTLGAIDMGSPGADTVFGAGRLNLQSAPSAPALLSPLDGTTGLPTSVVFTWRKSTDPDGDQVTYNLYVGTDNTFTSVTPIAVQGAFSPTARAAAGGREVLPVLAFGIVAAIGVSRKRTRTVIGLAAALAVGAAFASCNSGQSGGGGIFGVEPVLTVTSTVGNLQPGTTYYWKVMADDGRGGTTDSLIFTFSTAP